MVDIFVQFQPKSNFLDRCSQYLSDFNRSRIFLTNAPNFCPISTEVEFSWQMLPIFVRFQPKSNFFGKCSQFLSDFNRSKFFLTNAPKFCPISTEVKFFLTNAPNFCPILTKVEFSWQILPGENFVMKTFYPIWSVIPTEIMALRTQNDRRRKMLMVVTNVPSLPMQQERIMTWALRSLVNLTHFRQNAGSDGSKKQNEASHINKDSSLLWAFLLCFASAIDLLVAGWQILLLIFGKTWGNAKPASRHNKFWNKTKE